LRELVTPGQLVQGSSWHPNGRSLLISLGGDLVRVTDGSRRRLVPPSFKLRYPTFDATGERLAAIEKTESYDLMSADPESGRMECLKCGERRLGWGSIGANGALVYRRNVQGGHSIFIADPRTGANDPLEGTPRGASCPVFSPDGRLVAYLSSDSDQVSLQVVAVSGGEPMVLASRVEGSEYPSWSPDGRFLAFAAGSPIQVWVVSALGGEARAVSPPGGDYPTWSPDGRWIAYVVWSDASDEDQGAWVVAPEGGEPLKISDHPTRLAWRPDGSGLRQLRRAEDRVEIFEAIPGVWRWQRLSLLELGRPAPPHFEYMPLTVDPTSGNLVMNVRQSRSTLLVFEGLDPERW
jgi:dipeptidyl aminopeptidase/acylaminoacyl peptidase